MGAAGRQRVLEHFSWRAVARATAAAYAELDRRGARGSTTESERDADR